MPDKLTELSVRRMNSAKECLSAAKSNFENGFYKTAANREYYAIFHAMRAVLALDEFDSKKHQVSYPNSERITLRQIYLIPDFR